MSLTVIGTDTDRTDTYDFLLTFHSNHGLIFTVSKILPDIGRTLGILPPDPYLTLHRGGSPKSCVTYGT